MINSVNQQREKQGQGEIPNSTNIPQLTKVVSSNPGGKVPKAPAIVSSNNKNVPKVPQMKIPVPIKVPELPNTNIVQTPNITSSNKKQSEFQQNTIQKPQQEQIKQINTPNIVSNTTVNNNIINPSSSKVNDVIQNDGEVNQNIPIQKQAEPKQDFKALMMQKFNSRMGGNKPNNEIPESTPSSSTTGFPQSNTTSDSTPVNANFDKSPMSLNLPNKDPKTGKIIIDVPEGTKNSERLDINKLINQANVQKGKNPDTSSKSKPVTSEPKVNKLNKKFIFLLLLYI